MFQELSVVWGGNHPEKLHLALPVGSHHALQLPVFPLSACFPHCSLFILSCLRGSSPSLTADCLLDSQSSFRFRKAFLTGVRWGVCSFTLNFISSKINLMVLTPGGHPPFVSSLDCSRGNPADSVAWAHCSSLNYIFLKIYIDYTIF